MPCVVTFGIHVGAGLFGSPTFRRRSGSAQRMSRFGRSGIRTNGRRSFLLRFSRATPCTSLPQRLRGVVAVRQPENTLTDGDSVGAPALGPSLPVSVQYRQPPFRSSEVSSRPASPPSPGAATPAELTAAAI